VQIVRSAVDPHPGLRHGGLFYDPALVVLPTLRQATTTTVAYQD
jgi:hypothetical protein